MSEKHEHPDAIEEHDVEAHAARTSDAEELGASQDEDEVEAHIKFN